MRFTSPSGACRRLTAVCTSRQVSRVLAPSRSSIGRCSSAGAGEEVRSAKETYLEGLSYKSYSELPPAGGLTAGEILLVTPIDELSSNVGFPGGAGTCGAGGTAAESAACQF